MATLSAPTRVRRVRAIAITMGVALIGFVAFAVVQAQQGRAGSFPAVPAPTRLAAGARAPGFRASRLGGGAPVVFDGRSSRPTVVNFFASWCSDCVAELHAFATAARSAGPVRFVGLDTLDPSPTAAARLLRRAGITYPVGIDRSGSIAGRYLVAALPVTFFVSPSGVVRGEIVGRASTATLRHWIGVLAGPAR